MTTKVFAAGTRIEAWLASTEHLMQHGDALNVLLDIASPSTEGKGGRDASKMLDALYRKESALPLHAVAETIFPGWEYLHRGVDGVYTRYPGQYNILKKGSPQRWGTYAARLLSRGDETGQETNPLKVLVDKMRRIHKEGTAKYRACYEMGIAGDWDELSLYDGERDENRVRGGPCLTHLSFKLMDGHVFLTALYRSHDYRYKVPGNLLGLARLQAFVAREVDAKIGSLVVHSTLAFLDPGGGKGSLRKLLDDVKEILNAQA